jgi:purine nucleosidase
MNILRIALTGILAAACVAPAFGPRACAAQPATAAAQTRSKATPELAILDTDIGDDIDDAYALALLLHSPEIKLLGITTAFGDTELRARLTDRYLAAVHRSEIPVAVGRQTSHTNVFSQAAYAKQQPDHAHPEAVKFLLDQIRAHPGQITLIAIGPLVNVQDAIARDAATFRKLKRVVMMGGSVYRGYDTAGSSDSPPDAEWNIARDPEGASALLASGVPVYMMPLDSTQIHLEEVQRERIFAFGSPLTDQLTLLYHQWMAGTDNHSTTPTLFDPVAAAYAIHPELCPMKPFRFQIDSKGFTSLIDGTPNASVCLKSDEDGFLEFLVGRVTSPEH